MLQVTACPLFPSSPRQCVVVEPRAPEVGYLPPEEYRPAGFPEQLEASPTPPLEDVDGDEDDLEALEDGR